MASVPDHPWSEEDKTLEAAAQPHPGGSHSSRSSAPHRRRNDDSVKRSLATVCEPHQKALAAISTLEKEIERLNCTPACLQSRARSKSRDHRRPSGEGQKKRCHQVRFTDEPAPSQSADPKTQPGEEGSEGRGSDLEELPELKPNSSLFPARVAGDFRWWGWEDASRACYFRLQPVGPMEGREMRDPRLVDGTVSSAGERRCQKASQGSEGILWTPMAVVGIGLKGGHSPGSPCTAMAPQKKGLCPQLTQFLHVGTFKRSPGKKWWHMPGPSSIGQSKTICLLEVSHAYWREAFWSWGRRWNGTSPSLTKRSFGGVALPEEEEDSLQTPCATNLPETHCVPESLPEGRAPKFLG